jgi:hypothetical protein
MSSFWIVIVIRFAGLIVTPCATYDGVRSAASLITSRFTGEKAI